MACRKLSDAERWQAIGMVRGDMSYKTDCSWSHFQRSFCLLAFFYTPGLVHTLLQSNNDRVAYIESFSSLSCRTYHPLPFQEANGLSTGALADGPSIDVLTAQGFVLGDR
jgi:hypothetical protein